MRNLRFRKPTTTLVVLALVAILVASGESNTATKVEPDDSNSVSDEAEDSASSSEVFRIGDLVELGEWQIRVHSVTDPLNSSNEFITPSTGNRWVAVEVEVTNKATESATMSTLMCLELQDASNQNFSIALTAEDFPELDGEVAPNSARRGTVVFEVPQSAGGLVLKFNCDLFSSGQAFIKLN